MLQELLEKYMQLMIDNNIDLNINNDKITHINEDIIYNKNNPIHQLLTQIFLNNNNINIDKIKNIFPDSLIYLIEDFLEENEIEYETEDKNIDKNDDYMIKIINTSKNPYTKEEEIEIFTKLNKLTNNYEKAKLKQEIVSHYYKLIFKIANRYYSYLLTNEDLFQNGIIGLYIAIDKFDLTKNVRFSTYATIWIRQKISETACQYSLPALNITKATQAYRNIYSKLCNKLNRIPTDDEIAKYTDLTQTQIVNIKKHLPQYFELENQTSTDSKQTTLSNIEKHYLELMPNDYQLIEEKMMQEYFIKFYIDRLVTDPRQNTVLKMSNGIYPYTHKMTLDKISKHFNISREFARQLSNKALKKIKVELLWEKNQTIIDQLEQQMDMDDLLQLIETAVINKKHILIIKNRHGLSPYTKKATLEQLVQDYNIELDNLLKIINRSYKKIQDLSSTIQKNNTKQLVKK